MQLDTDHANSIDGLNAGSYAPVNPLIIGGSGLAFTLPASGEVAGMDWPIFHDDAGSVRTFGPRAMLLAFGVAQDGSADFTITVKAGTGNTVPYLTGGATNQGAFVPLNMIPDGATVTAAAVKLSIKTGHGALPAEQPVFSILAVPIGSDVSPTLEMDATMAAGSVATYENSGNEQTVSLTGSFTVNRNAFNYYLVIVDENGANSQSGNLFRMLELTWTCADMRPPW